MKKLFNIFPILYLSLLGLFPILNNGNAIACGPGIYPDDARFYLFDPVVANYPQVMAFQYSQSWLHSYSQEDLLIDRKLNCKEWYDFTKGKASEKDVEDIQYNASADSFLTAYQTNNWNIFGDNSFIKWLLEKKNKKAMQYFVLAKLIEKNQQWKADQDAWKDTPYPSNFPSLDSLQHAAYLLLNKKQPSFLKERYAFQYVKCIYYYFLDNDRKPDVTQANHVFEKYLAAKSTITAQWALIYYADMQTDSLQRTMNFIKAFDRCEEKKVRAFSYIDNNDLTALAAATKDEKLLVLIKVLQSLKNPGRAINELQYVYTHDPENKYLPLLITREINKLEDWIFTPDIIGFTSQLRNENVYLSANNNSSKTAYDFIKENYESDKLYLNEVLQQLMKMQETGFQEKDFLHLALSHVLLMCGQYDKAQQQLNAVTIRDKNAQIQWLIEKTMLIVNKEDIAQDQVKEELAASLQQLADLGYRFDDEESNVQLGEIQKPYKDVEILNKTMNNPGALYVYISEKYFAAKDVVTASLLSQQSRMMINIYQYSSDDSVSYAPLGYLDKYATPEDVDKIIALKHKGNKSKWEKFISPATWGSDNMYLDLKGSLLLRESKFEEALAVFQSMPDDFWENSYEFNSYLPINSVTDVGSILPASSGNGKVYSATSKKLITEEIIQLKNKIINASSKDTSALYSFYLANALFSISHYGHGWMLSVYGNSTTEPYIPNQPEDYHWVYHYVYPSATNHVENYYGLESAIAMYKNALSLAVKDKELAAKCVLMLAVCDDINFNYRYVLQHPEIFYAEREPYYSPYIQQLKDKYGGTMVFNNAMQECPDVNNYFNK